MIIYIFFSSSSNLGDFTHDVRILAALQEDDNGNKLLDAARRLAGGLSDLLNAAQPENREVICHCCAFIFNKLQEIFALHSCY